MSSKQITFKFREELSRKGEAIHRPIAEVFIKGRRGEWFRFFNFNFETPKFNNIPEDSKVEAPWYIEPLTTNIEKIEVRYLESDTYLVPKTTAGMI